MCSRRILLLICIANLATAGWAAEFEEAQRAWHAALERGDRDAAKREASALIATAKSAANEPAVARALNRSSGEVRAKIADLELAEQLAVAALDLARSGGYLENHLDLFEAAADVARMQRRYPDELRLAQEWNAIAARTGQGAQIVRAAFSLTDAHWNLDQLDQGLAVAQGAVATAREQGDLGAASLLLLRAAGTYRRVADVKMMIRLLTEAVETTRQSGDPGIFAEAAGQFALAQINYGDRAAGEAILEEAGRTALQSPSSPSSAVALAHIAAAHFRLGHADQAASFARVALAHARSSELKSQQCHAAATLVRVLDQLGQPEEARKVGEENIPVLLNEPAARLSFEERRGLSDLSEALGELCASQRDFEAALAYQRTATRVRNIDTEARHKTLIAQAESRMEGARQEEKIRGLELDQQMRKLELASERSSRVALDEAKRAKELELEGAHRERIFLAAIALLTTGMLVGTVQRIRTQRRSAALLREQNEQLRKLDAEKDEFLAMAAHDLKSPLGGIQRGCELLADPQTDDSFGRELARDMAHSAARMFHLITRLLDLHRVRQEDALAPCNLTELTRSLHREALHKAAAKQIALDFVAPAEAVRALGNPVRVNHIIDNLLSNALKFSPPGKRVTLEVSSDAGVPWVAITDEGPGISPAEQANLFRKFSRLSARPTAGEHSSGLGLSIVHAQVVALGGTIACESEPGRGARFVVRFQPVGPRQKISISAAA